MKKQLKHQDPVQTGSKKQQYNSPSVAVFGDISTLTEAVGDTDSDGVGVLGTVVES